MKKLNIDLKHLSPMLIEAWAKICDFPAPPASREAPSPGVLLLMPILAWVAGILCCLAVLLMRLLFNPASGILLFLLISWIFLSWKDSGRSDRMLMREILLRFRPEEADSVPPLLLSLPPLVLRFLLLFFLAINEGTAYLPVFLLFSAGTQALLIRERSSAVRGRKDFFILIGLLFFFSFLFCRAGSLFALAGCLILDFLRRRRNPSPPAEKEALIFCGITEWVLLTVGILAL